jgi:hypothetical protein
MSLPILCSQCQKTGDFRPGHRQCKECEGAKGRARYHVNRENHAAYRARHQDHYRELNRQIRLRRRIENRQVINKHKSVPCADCSRNYPSYVMDFDHINPETKVANISALLNHSASWVALEAEIEKCEVVCVNCHRLRTWRPPTKVTPRSRLTQALKDVPCADCQGVFHYCQMDFDHVRGEKVTCVPHAGSLSAIRKEAGKCEVVCANCHRERTQGAEVPHRVNPDEVDMNWRRETAGPQSAFTSEAPRRQVSRHWHSWAGQMPDIEVAALGGVTKSAVCVYRQKQGIPSYRATAPASAEWHTLVGTMPDTKLAEQVGVSRKTVGRHRKQFGLPAYRSNS